MSVVSEVIKKLNLERLNLCIACSGGLDSTVLLEALVLSGYKPLVLHINYHLRGEDSEKDEAFVRNLAQKHQLDIEVIHCPKELTKGKGINLQEAARKFRHELFQNFIEKNPDNRVLLAHHQDDQNETFFLQLIRGSGIFGLGGMHPERNGIIRPFLSLTKETLRTFALENQILWREDLSNTENHYKRNQFRNIILPELLKSIPTLNNSIQLIQDLFREEQNIIRGNLTNRLTNWKQNKEISFAEWNQLSVEEHIIVCNFFAWPFWLIQRIQELENATLSSKIDNSPIFKTKAGFSWSTNFPQSEHWEFKIEEVEFLPEVFSKWEAYFDPEKCLEPLTQSTAEKADYIRKNGVKGKTNIYKLLKDHGVPEQWRSSYPVFKSGKEVIWIPGITLSENHLQKEATTLTIKVSKTTKEA